MQMLKLLSLSAILLVLLAAGNASEVQLTQSDVDTISLYIRAVLENLKVAMPDGIPELSIPPLEPLDVPVIDVPRIQDGIADVKLRFDNMQLKGLSGFNVENVKADLSTLGLNLELYFPTLQGKSAYDLDGKILIFPLFGKGNAYVQINDLRAKGSGSMTIVDGKLQLNDISVDSTFSQVQVYLEGIVGGGNLGDVVNTVINSLGKLIYDQTKPLWLAELNRIIKDAVNNELKNVDIQDIIGGVLPPGISYKSPADESANNYVDRLMEELRPHLSAVDPLGIPDQIASFSKKILFVTVYGSATLTSGRLSGLKTIFRAGDCQVSVSGIKVTVDCEIGVNSLNGGFNAAAQFMGIGVSARVNLFVPRVRVRFRVSAELREGASPELDLFYITEVSQVGVSVQGLGPLDWILNIVSNVAVNAAKGAILSAIEGPVREELRKVLGSVQIPNLAA